MLYAILATDRPGSLAARLDARPAHLERLRALQEEGRLILAGPHPAIDSPDPLSLFDGEPTGGCFWVFVADGASLDTGTVFGATVALETGGSTPIQGVTWGEIKSTY